MSEVGQVLLVDDEPEILDILSDEVKSLGFNVLVAENGEQALQKLADPSSGFIDTVISDLNMPVMPGMELLKRARQAKPHLPWIILTGFGTEEVSSEAFRLGVMEFLSKPFDMDSMKKSIRQATLLGIEMRNFDEKLESRLKSKRRPSHLDEETFRTRERLSMMAEIEEKLGDPDEKAFFEKSSQFQVGEINLSKTEEE